MHYAIIGAGNMGSLYGANLARIGHDVVLIDIAVDHVDAINRDGLRVDGLYGEFLASVVATTDVSTVSGVDVAMVCVNGYSTREAAETASEILGPEGFVVSLQNGVGNIEVLVDVLGDDRVLGGLTFHSGDMPGTGRVSHTNEGPTYLGEIDGAESDRLALLVEHLELANMLPVVEADIMKTIWSKFVHNCGINAICAITDVRPGHIRAIPELDEFQRQVIGEVLAFVAAKRVELDDPDPLETIREYCSKKFHRVSMSQHLARGVRTEIDSLNGYVAREAAKYGISTPANDALTRLIKGSEFIT